MRANADRDRHQVGEAVHQLLALAQLVGVVELGHVNHALTRLACQLLGVRLSVGSLFLLLSVALPVAKPGGQGRKIGRIRASGPGPNAVWPYTTRERPVPAAALSPINLPPNIHNCW